MIKNPEDILIHHIYFPVVVLGQGERVGIWFQGCSIHCKGCMSRDTWDFDEKYRIPFPSIIAKLKQFRRIGVDKITISGGEPFDQSEELYLLLTIIRSIGYTDVLVYSGYDYSYLFKKFNKHLPHIDLLISGPFEEENTDNKIWCGSDNQEIHVLTHNQSYNEENLNQTAFPIQREIQIESMGDNLYLIGIPRREDVDNIIMLLNKSVLKK